MRSRFYLSWDVTSATSLSIQIGAEQSSNWFMTFPERTKCIDTWFTFSISTFYKSHSLSAPAVCLMTRRAAHEIKNNLPRRMSLIYRFGSKPEPTTTDKLYGWIDFTWTVTEPYQRQQRHEATATDWRMCVLCDELTELTGFTDKKMRMTPVNHFPACQSKVLGSIPLIWGSNLLNDKSRYLAN